MPLQNRVSPNGDIVAVAAKGAWMGNRGCLHGADRELTSTRWTRKQWVICELKYADRHRQVMAPGKYTELFFLDEATALAAGHRPCGTCRKAAYKDLLSAWNAVASRVEQGVMALDSNLHAQRAAVIGHDALPMSDLTTIPDYCMIALEGSRDPYLVYLGHLYCWSFDGYIPGPPIKGHLSVRLITPPVITKIIASGYIPQIHPSVVEQGSNLTDSGFRSISQHNEYKEPSKKFPVGNMNHTLPDAVPASPQLYRMNKTPSGKELFAYFAAILQVTGMDKGKSFPLKKFMNNFSGHESAGRIIRKGAGSYRLSEDGIKYFNDRFRLGSSQRITQDEVNRYKLCILTGGSKGWGQTK